MDIIHIIYNIHSNCSNKEYITDAFDIVHTVFNRLLSMNVNIPPTLPPILQVSKKFTKNNNAKYTSFAFSKDLVDIASASMIDNASLCPVCLTPIMRSDGCNFIKHNCSIAGVPYNKQMYNMFKNGEKTGLTTAAGLWVTAAIGVACGFGFFTLATIATIATVLTFTLLWTVEDKYIAPHDDTK
jgi:hypothetical protein